MIVEVPEAVIDIFGRRYTLRGSDLSVEEIVRQLNDQAGYALARVDGRGRLRVMEPNGVGSRLVEFNHEKALGRLVHQELPGRRKPEGWAKAEIAALRKMKRSKR